MLSLLSPLTSLKNDFEKWFVKNSSKLAKDTTKKYSTDARRVLANISYTTNANLLKEYIDHYIYNISKIERNNPNFTINK